MGTITGASNLGAWVSHFWIDRIGPSGFANSDVTGRAHDTEARKDRTSQYGAGNGELVISNGAFSGNEFTANVAGAVSPGTIDADLFGRFFGPAAAEVGGVLSGKYAERGETIVLYGFFAGKKQ